MTPRRSLLRFLRLVAIGVTAVAGVAAVASCRLTIAMKNVYFRPVYDAVESGEGDPYMIALGCVATFADELTGPIVILALSALFLLALAILPTCRNPPP